MKTIGLIGGMSWESTKYYYEILNRQIQKELGGLHSAQCLLYSFDFQTIKELQFQGNWDEASRLLAEAAKNLERAGADFIILCTNTMHISAESIEKNINIPFLHIADGTAKKIKNAGIKRVALLGTNFTMEEDFYKGRLEKNHQLEVLIPAEKDRKLVHDIIYKELCLGEIREESKEIYKDIINRLIEMGAEGVILGCTEIGLLIQQKDVTVSLFDTTEIHALEAVKMSLSIHD